jgi:hypothetical protein
VAYTKLYARLTTNLTWDKLVFSENEISGTYVLYKNNVPRSFYALHILNRRHEYGNIDDIMTLLKQVIKPSLLLPYEQMVIQSLHHSKELVTEEHSNECNPMFELLRAKNLTSQTSKTPNNNLLPADSSHSNCAPTGHHELS